MSEQLPLIRTKPKPRAERLLAYLDVETVCPPEIPRETLMQLAGDRDADVYGATCAPIARIVSVAILLDDPSRWFVGYCDSSSNPLLLGTDQIADRFGPEILAADGRVTMCQDEATLMHEVHEVLGRSPMTLVTFNGRRFDYPVLVHRAVAHGVRPAINVLKAARESRYNMQHEDLFEEMSFHGASTASLRAYAIGMGLPDPKANGDGSQVAAMVREGRLLDLCAYNLSDCVTLRELRRRWRAMVD